MNHLSKSGVIVFNIIDADFNALIDLDNRQSAVPFFLWLQSTGTAVMVDSAVSVATGICKTETLRSLRRTFSEASIGHFTRRERGHAYAKNTIGFEMVKGRKRTVKPYFQFPRVMAHRSRLSWSEALVYLYLCRRLSRAETSSFQIPNTVNTIAVELKLDRRVVAHILQMLKKGKLLGFIGVKDRVITMFNPNNGKELKEVPKVEQYETQVVLDAEGRKCPIDFNEENNRQYWAAVLTELGEPDTLLDSEGFEMCCPFHDDVNPSLSVTPDFNHWECFASCGGGGILDFEQRLFQKNDIKHATCSRHQAHIRTATKMGLNAIDAKYAVTSTHMYRDARGATIYKVDRLDDAKKSGRYKRLVNGDWEWGRGDVAVLYNLPEVLTADVVIVVEGEKKADILTTALTARGWGGDFQRIAVTTTGGWNTWKEPGYIISLKGKYVVIMHDADEGGQKYREAIEGDCINHGVKFKSVEFVDQKDFRPTLVRMDNDVTRLLKLVAPEIMEGLCKTN